MDVTDARAAQAELESLVSEQAALRRVATLVAKEAPPQRSSRASRRRWARARRGRLLLFRDEADGTATVVGSAEWTLRPCAARPAVPDDGDGVSRPCCGPAAVPARRLLLRRDRRLAEIARASRCSLGRRLPNRRPRARLGRDGYRPLQPLVLARDRDPAHPVRRSGATASRTRTPARGHATRRGAGGAAAGGDAGRAKAPRRPRSSTPWRGDGGAARCRRRHAVPLRAGRRGDRVARRGPRAELCRPARGFATTRRTSTAIVRRTRGPLASRLRRRRSDRRRAWASARPSARRSSSTAGSGACRSRLGRTTSRRRPTPKSGWRSSPSCSTPPSPTPTAGPAHGLAGAPRHRRRRGPPPRGARSARRRAAAAGAHDHHAQARSASAPRERRGAESLVGEALEHAERATRSCASSPTGSCPPCSPTAACAPASTRSSTRLDLPVDVDVPAERFPPEIEASAYFIVAEALTNVVKHARADARRGHGVASRTRCCASRCATTASAAPTRRSRARRDARPGDGARRAARGREPGRRRHAASPPRCRSPEQDLAGQWPTTGESRWRLDDPSTGEPADVSARRQRNTRRMSARKRSSVRQQRRAGAFRAEALDGPLDGHGARRRQHDRLGRLPAAGLAGRHRRARLDRSAGSSPARARSCSRSSSPTSAARFPRTGGPYAYARRAFGDFVGFQTAWGYWIAVWAGNAAIAVAFVGYLTVFWPAVGDQQPARRPRRHRR